MTLKRTNIRSRYRSTGPIPAVVEIVVERDFGCCGWCAVELWGERGIDWSIGHRRARRAGGDRRPETNLPGNLVALHGCGTTRCHGAIEDAEHAKAKELGFVLHSMTMPADEPITHAVHGRVRLDDRGGWVACGSS